jgi:hypothetical protein
MDANVGKDVPANAGSQSGMRPLADYNNFCPVSMAACWFDCME